MFTKRGLSIVKNKIKRTWQNCGSITASSIEELAFILNEQDFSTFLEYLYRLEEIDHLISLIRRDDGLYCLDYLKWNEARQGVSRKGN